MEEKDLVQRGNTLSVNLGVTYYNYGTFATKTSPEYRISGTTLFQMKVIAAHSYSTSYIYNNLICVKFVKISANDNLIYTIKFTSYELGILNKNFTSDDGTWHLVYDANKRKPYTFDVLVQMEIAPSASSFVTLHDDTEQTDFELRGEDGSVHVHRAVLAASSPVLRRMLGGTWRETTEGSVDVLGTTRLTLEHLKNYVYLHTLPETGLEQILLLASYYMMPDLEQKCVLKLVSSLTAQNACDLLEFSTKHKVQRLLLAILECIQSGEVKVDDMRDHYLRGG